MNIIKLHDNIREYIWGSENWLFGANTELFSKEELGTNALDFNFFPQLIKIIDSNLPLSVQVHPNDDYAQEYEKSAGKTEMWYILDAKDGAGIYLGFKSKIKKDVLKKAISENTLTDFLNFYPVKKGDCFFVPAGTVHAIGAGCKICEIQENSTITYRLYDYGRVDKNNNPRELHVEKALDVLNLNKFTNTQNGSDVIALSKYFCVKKHLINGKAHLPCDCASFKYVICTEGEGVLNSKYKLKPYTSYFIPAHDGEITVEGNMTLLTSETRKLFVCADVGGTFIKCAVLDDLGNILCHDKCETESGKGEGAVVNNLLNLAKKLTKSLNITLDDVSGIGLSVPGTINSESGCVVYSNNLKWQNFNIAKAIKKKTGLCVKALNDANAAALGEYIYGSKTKTDSAVLITLGTGVGSGIILNGKLFEGNQSAGAEIGHTTVMINGEECTCGRRGCLEAYASATALIRDTKRAMLENKDSRLWEVGIENVNGKTAFDYKDVDETAKKVVDNYISYLASGIVNIANALRVEQIIIGGGLSEQGDGLIKPLQEILNCEIFGKNMGPSVEIRKANLGNTAGMLGALHAIKEHVSTSSK